MVNYYWDRYNANPIYNYRVTWDEFNDGSYSEWKIPDLNNPSTKYYFNASANSNGEIILTNEVYGAHLTTIGGVIFRKYENQPHSIPTALKVLAKYDGSVRVTAKNLQVIQDLAGYSKGSLVQANVVADYNAYTPNARNADGYWYVRGAVYNSAPTTPGAFTNPAPGMVLKGGQVITVQHGAASDAESNISSYETHVQYNNDAFYSIRDAPGDGWNYTVTTDKTKTTMRLAVRAKDSGGLIGPWSYSPVYTINQNTAPTVTLATANNQTLYENDIFAINGTVTDIDSGNVVSVKYSIDGGAARAILANVSTGTAISYGKNLTFKAGILFDGANAISGALAEGSQHSLKVWAEDDKGGKSAEITRTFYVVPNRAATLVLNAFVTRTGLINTDVVNISGTVADLDANNVIVKYKIQNGAYAEVFNGPANATPKPFDFNVLLADLTEGENTIIIQAVDGYNAVTQQIITLRKSKNEVPLTSAVTYYEVIPPNGTTDGIMLWIERELGDLNVKVDVSMGMPGETEIFKPMLLESTANLANGNVEDTFNYQHTGDASKVVIRINMARTSAATNKAIKKISGVLT